MSRESERKRRARITARQAELRKERRGEQEHYTRWSTIVTMDPDDLVILVAHGFDPADPDPPRDEPCRNGCGRPFDEVIGYKMRQCPAPEQAATAEVQAAHTALWEEFRGQTGWV